MRRLNSLLQFTWFGYSKQLGRPVDRSTEPVQTRQMKQCTGKFSAVPPERLQGERRECVDEQAIPEDSCEWEIKKGVHGL